MPLYKINTGQPILIEASTLDLALQVARSAAKQSMERAGHVYELTDYVLGRDVPEVADAGGEWTTKLLDDTLFRMILDLWMINDELGSEIGHRLDAVVQQQCILRGIDAATAYHEVDK